MVKRFSRLKFAKKAAGGTAAADSPLSKYMDYASGKTVPTYTRAASSYPGGYEILTVAPFGGDVDQRNQVSISARAFDNLSNLVNIAAPGLFNHLTPAGTETVEENNLFIPAKAIIRVSTTGTTPETSKITGVKYRKESGAASYTVPFGAGTTAAGADRLYLNVARAINVAVRAKNEEYTVSFMPERWLGL